MKKSLLAIAVAGAVAAPISTIHAAEYTVSGYAQMDLMLSEEKTVGGAQETDVQSNGLNVNPNDLQINFGVTDDLGFGEGFANMRLDLDSLSGGTPETDSMRVGLRGNYGTVTLGEGSDYAESGQKAGDILGENPNTPNAALSYELPTFVPGLVVGVNLINDHASVDEDDSGNSGQLLTTGTALGASYSHDLGDAGSLGAGFGTSNVEKTTERQQENGSLEEESTQTDSYQSIGVNYAISGVSIALARQTYEWEKEVGDTKTEYEPFVSTDIKLGYSTGPISVAITQSNGEGFAKIRGGYQEKDDDDRSTAVTRIDAAYALSDSTKVALRNQTSTDEVDNTAKDSSASFSRVSLSVSF